MQRSTCRGKGRAATSLALASIQLSEIGLWRWMNETRGAVSRVTSGVIIQNLPGEPAQVNMLIQNGFSNIEFRFLVIRLSMEEIRFFSVVNR